MYSKFSNCNLADDDISSNPYSNILSITSRRSTQAKFDTTQCLEVTMEEIEELYDKMSEIEDHSDEQLTDLTISHIASCIEKRIRITKQFGCSLCKRVFDENIDKAECVPVNSMSIKKSCQSTFLICKQTDRFLKVDLLKGDINFTVIYHEILQNLDFDSLYSETDFSHHYDHKIFLIRFVVDEYIKIKGTHIAKTLTLNEHKKVLRVRLHKLLHYLGQ